MKIILALAVTQLFLLVTGADTKGEHKQVGCFYWGGTSKQHGTLYPEDIDASICSHLLYLEGSMDNETEEFKVDALYPWLGTGGAGFIPRLVKLKEVNPDLKLILMITPAAVNMILESPRRANMISNGVKWLNESGFDGMEFPVYVERGMEEMADMDLLCEMKSEFDKYGYMVTALLVDYSFSEPNLGKEGALKRLTRCCDHITLVTEERPGRPETYQFAPLNSIKSNVEWFIERGYSPNKIMFSVPAFGLFVTLEDSNVTGLGAEYSGPGNEYKEFSGWNTIRQKDLLRNLNDSSLGWTFRRDNETQVPYAFSTTGLWTSYEDTTSISQKARYVLEKGLKGMSIVPLDMDDGEGVGGEGRFLLTRAVYNTFRGGNQSEDATP